MANQGFLLFSSQGVPAAGSYGSTILDLKANQQKLPISMSANAKFTYGSGGTTCDIYIQTSFDGGTTWADVMNFHFTTANDNKFGNVSRQAAVVPVSITDATLANNTKNDGLLGPLWRAKMVVAGTYAGTLIEVHLYGEN